MSDISEYADVAEMFRRLKVLDEGSPAFRRQREAIVERCLPLADHVAHRYRNRGEPVDDLVQVARLGLLHAINRFDVDNGADFLAFTVPTMMGEVRRHFRDYGWAVKVPRRVKDLQPQVVKARAALSQQLGRSPNATEIAECLGIDRDLVTEATIGGGNYSTMSTDARAGSGDDRSPTGETRGKVDPNLDKVLDIATVRPLIAALPERQRTVLTLRFFDNLSQTQIAERVGCSQMHVSRLLAKALETLRSHICEPELVATG